MGSLREEDYHRGTEAQRKARDLMQRVERERILFQGKKAGDFSASLCPHPKNPLLSAASVASAFNF
jgi:hypothetical protein